MVVIGPMVAVPSLFFSKMAATKPRRAGIGLVEIACISQLLRWDHLPSRAEGVTKEPLPNGGSSGNRLDQSFPSILIVDDLPSMIFIAAERHRNQQTARSRTKYSDHFQQRLAGQPGVPDEPICVSGVVHAKVFERGNTPDQV